jgi:membrane peptidoglycan carboxypeptidase
VPYYPFVLGAQPARLIDLAAFYAAVANEGARPSPHAIESIEQNGTTIYRHNSQTVWLGSGDRVSFYQLKSILQGVVARGTAASLARMSPYVAGKTGTSDDENDAWFIGLTNDVTIGVWVGYDNAQGRRTLGSGMTGGKVALPIFEPIMEAVWRDYARKTPLAAPSQLAGRHMAAIPVEYYSGEPVPPGTQGAFTEYLRLDSAGRLADTRYNLVSRDEAYWARNYDPGGDGDLYGPYASRSGGGYYYGGPPSGYDDRGYVTPGGSMFQQRGPFGGIFGDQRYFEQQEYNRQRQRRVDPDYFIDRFRTN